MAISFDDVVPALLSIGVTDTVLTTAERVAVVRDPLGRVRLAIDSKSATSTQRSALEASLEGTLGKWYAGPTLYADADGAPKRLAVEVLNRAKDQWPPGWPATGALDPVTGAMAPIDPAKWGAIQRVLSKETWLAAAQHTSLPWPLLDQTPTIVSFYSYKGGVGRSTLVAIVAATLAREGEKVVVVDLDLEAPGQQSLFDVEPTRGVIDYVVEHVTLGGSSLDELLIDVTHEVDGATGSVRLAAAGSFGWSYVEKIARLDYVGHTHQGDSPVARALGVLLKQIKSTHDPDWILLDARTGIHDLGGLAMHALAHIDVLIARSGRQAREGLELCLEALGRRRDPDDLLTLIVHALVPAPLTDATVSKPSQDAFRHEVYELFEKTLYRDVDDALMPAEDDASAPHAPHPVPLDEALARLETVRDAASLTVGRDPYEKIVKRLRELAKVES